MSEFMRGIYRGGVSWILLVLSKLHIINSHSDFKQFQFIPDEVTIEDLPDLIATLGQLNEWTEKHFQDSVEVTVFSFEVDTRCWKRKR